MEDVIEKIKNKSWYEDDTHSLEDVKLLIKLNLGLDIHVHRTVDKNDKEEFFVTVFNITYGYYTKAWGDNTKTKDSETSLLKGINYVLDNIN